MRFLLVFLTGCSGAVPGLNPDCPQCPTCPDAASPTASGGSLTAAEQALLQDSITDLRQGIRPFDDQSVGVCLGTGKECVEYKGTTATDLPPGEYMFFARLTAPKITPEDKWTVGFSKACETTKKNKNGETTSTNNFSKDYRINYGPKGYRLSPLATITSPGKRGAQSCTWTLTFHNPNGSEEMTGSWSVPAAE